LEKPEVLPTKGMKLSDAVKKITGKPGTPIKLTVQREGEDKPLEFNLTRGFVQVESVLGFKRKTNDDKTKDDWDYMIDPVNKKGYIRLTQFARNSYKDLEHVMSDLTD